MRSQLLVLVLALGFALWMMFEFVTVGSTNMPTIRDRFAVGLVAVGPLLFVAGSAAVATVRRRTDGLKAAETGLLVAGLIVGLVWALGLAWSSG